MVRLSASEIYVPHSLSMQTIIVQCWFYCLILVNRMYVMKSGKYSSTARRLIRWNVIKHAINASQVMGIAGVDKLGIMDEGLKSSEKKFKCFWLFICFKKFRKLSLLLFFSIICLRILIRHRNRLQCQIAINSNRYENMESILHFEDRTAASQKYHYSVLYKPSSRRQNVPRSFLKRSERTQFTEHAT